MCVIAVSPVGEKVESQSPYGAKWFATGPKPPEGSEAYRESQSPYGAKWFATARTARYASRPSCFVAIPLRG